MGLRPPLPARLRWADFQPSTPDTWSAFKSKIRESGLISAATNHCCEGQCVSRAVLEFSHCASVRAQPARNASRLLEFLHCALIFSPGPGEKGAAAAPKRGSFVSAPASGARWSFYIFAVIFSLFTRCCDAVCETESLGLTEGRGV